MEEPWLKDECKEMKSIWGLAQGTKLRILDVHELSELSSMETLTSSERLWEKGCVKPKSIRGLEHATNIRPLGCVKPKSIRGLEHATKLRIQYVHGLFRRATKYGNIDIFGAVVGRGMCEAEEH